MVSVLKKPIKNQKIEKKDYTDWTKHDYKMILKRFFKWLRGFDDYPDEVKWIKVTVKRRKNLLPEELLTEEDVKKLIDSADYPRDKALVSLLYESGCRIIELNTLTIKHVSFDDYGAQIVVSGGKGMRR